MAKAVVPMRAFRQKFGDLSGEQLSARLQELVAQFLHEAQKDVKTQKVEGRSEEPVRS